MIVERKHAQSSWIRIDYIRNKDWRQWVFLKSDVHWDNPHCNRELYKAELDKAREMNAIIIDFGDLFCLMQGKYDPRRAKSSIRPEHNVNNYLDAVIQDAIEFHKPYADLYAVQFDGNHETSVKRNNETDINQRFVDMLNMTTGSQIQKMNYQGFIDFKFKCNHIKQSTLLFGHHGKFGGIVTKGLLGVGRYASMLPSVDIVVTGHTHDGWIVDEPQFKYSPTTGNVTVEPQTHIKCGTFKNEFLDGSGFGSERLVKPAAFGGRWLEFYYDPKDGKVKHIPHLRII